MLQSVSIECGCLYARGSVGIVMQKGKGREGSHAPGNPIHTVTPSIASVEY